MDLGLAGRTVIVTGGSGGIGRGLVMEFAREGCNVVSASRDDATGRKLAEEARTMGLAGRVLPVRTDVTRRESVDAMIEATHREFGRVDVLVNNAGGVAHPSEFEHFDEEGRRWEIALKIDGVVNSARPWPRTCWAASAAASSTSPRIPRCSAKPRRTSRTTAA